MHETSSAPSIVLWFFGWSGGRRSRPDVGDRCGRKGCWLCRRAWHRRRGCRRRIGRETLRRTLNDDLDERSLKNDDWVRLTRSPGGQDRDTDASAREQYHPAEGEKDLRDGARARPGSDPWGVFVFAPFGWSAHEETLMPKIHGC